MEYNLIMYLNMKYSVIIFKYGIQFNHVFKHEI